jgi:hypothetical protein
MRVSGGREVERKKEVCRWEISKLESLSEAPDREMDVQISSVELCADAWAWIERSEHSCVQVQRFVIRRQSR